MELPNYEDEIICLKEPQKLARDFAGRLKGGEVIGLIGELGAGKTTFIQALARSLGIKEKVNSPTFVLMKIYQVVSHPSISCLVHVDAYRLNNSGELKNIGLLEYLGRLDTVTVIEWADRVKEILPQGLVTVTISAGPQDEARVIDFS